jgi:hypothetical protein
MTTLYGRQFCAGYSKVSRPNPTGHIDISEITTSGWYSIRTPAGICHTWIECDFESDRNWALVLANRSSTGGMNNLRWDDAVKKVNIRTGGSNQGSNTTVTNFSNLNNLNSYNVWVGLDFWRYLGKRRDTSRVTVCQYVSTTDGIRLNQTGSHTKRARWTFTDFNFQDKSIAGAYSFLSPSQLQDDTGGGYPGMYGYHASGNFGLTTFDNDVDTNGGNCATYYNNNPFWYGSCWSGNWFAGGGYQDRPYWNSSGGDNHQYGGIYVC